LPAKQQEMGHRLNGVLDDEAKLRAAMAAFQRNMDKVLLRTNVLFLP